ncbi:GntR family transcriptional regulator [Agromyces sp. NPDC058484]|uniref:GntR family transcriptional regulator n=1 Tax=Agromyces sp. NPDC058484 TaxID=3346524 RepID=UPI00364EE15C
MVTLDLGGASPPSDQIHQQLRGLIMAGRIAPGERLPTVRQLSRDLGVAPGTVAKAYKLLESERFVQARARGGTIVSASPRGLPAEVLKPARELHDAAVRNELTLQDAITVLMGLWTNRN